MTTFETPNTIQIKESKLTKVGNSYFIRIPIALITHGYVNTEKTYNAILTVAEDVKTEKPSAQKGGKKK